MDSADALSRSRCRERRFNNYDRSVRLSVCPSVCDKPVQSGDKWT